MKYIIIRCSTDHIEHADFLAKKLVENRYAACVHIHSNVQSVYTWNQQIEHENEFLLEIKTRSDKERLIYELILESHHYKIPQLISMEITNMSEAYRIWMNSVLD